MRIAQVAPLFESVPPRYYGGTERVVSYLTEELVRLGHDVTLFASGDSLTKARLVSPCARALRLDKNALDRQSPHVLLVERLLQEAAAFDVIHSHLDFLPFPSLRRLAVPSLTTLHGRLDLPELQPLFDEYTDMSVVSISDAQRLPLPQARWRGTVYHGLPPDLLRFCPRAENYLAFLGRLSAEKGVDQAIAIARQAGMKLRIAAKIDEQDQAYYETVVEPLLRQPHVEFIGEISETEKEEFLGRAAALLFPIDWPEPFGMVMIEAMACGTPVIAYANGSVREVITPGVNGFIVDGVANGAEAVQAALRLPRAAVREDFEKRFTAERMAADYLRLYERLRQEDEEPSIVPAPVRLQSVATKRWVGAQEL